MFKAQFDDNAEKAIIGSLINEPVLIDELIVSEDDFFREQNKELFVAIKELGSDMLDIITLSDKTTSSDIMYMHECTTLGINSCNIKHWEMIVVNKSVLRQQTLAAEEVIKLNSNGEDASEIFAKAQNFDTHFDGELENMDTIITETMEEIQNHLDGNTEPGIMSDMRGLDFFLDGFKNSDLYYLGARPSIGKTALALQIIKNMAEKNKKIAFFSLEMSKTSLGKRLLVNHSRMHLNFIKDKKVDADGLKRLNAAASRLYQQNIAISDKGGQTVESILMKAKRHKKKHGLDIIFIDHFHILENKKLLNNANDRATYNSRMLKYMAKELEIPVVCLVQLNRKLEERPVNQRMPMMSDLRDSGSLEQDADAIIFLNRNDYWFKDEKDYQPDNIADIKIAKHRNGETGKFSMYFYGGTQRFEETN